MILKLLAVTGCVALVFLVLFIISLFKHEKLSHYITLIFGGAYVIFFGISMLLAIVFLLIEIPVVTIVSFAIFIILIFVSESLS